jgi:hypothetical protein
MSRSNFSQTIYCFRLPFRCCITAHHLPLSGKLETTGKPLFLTQVLLVEMLRIILVTIAIISSCKSFKTFIPAVTSRIKQTNSHISLLAATLNQLDLSVDDIAARWKVVKFGQGSGSYNGIELADRLLSVKTVKVPMSRVGGLGLDLAEYNLGKGELILIRERG